MKIGDLVSYKFGDLGTPFEGDGIIISKDGKSLITTFIVFDYDHGTIVKNLYERNMRITEQAHEKSVKEAELLLERYKKIIKKEKSPIILLD